MGRPGAHRIDTPTASDLAVYQAIRDHAAKGALSMIDIANHKPENLRAKPKIGGHQASSMSAVDLLTALYLHALAPGDRLAVKPHAAPVVYALMHLFGVLDTDAMSRLREIGGPQPYPTKLKSPLFVDYTTSSEGLGVAATIYDAYGALHQNRALREALGGAAVKTLTTTYFAHCGDGELTEGQIDESLYDAGRWRLDNLIWIVDLNRQSLDRVMDDSGRLEDWAAAKFAGHGWQVERLRWGARAEALFARPGGEALQAVLERLGDALYHPLTIVDGDVARRALTGVAAHDDPAIAGLLSDYARRLPATAEERAGIARALDGLGDAELTDGLTHLGGHDIGAIIASLAEARHADGPIVILAHTVKGYETSASGHPENHGALLPAAEVAAWGVADKGLPAGVPFPRPASDSDAGRHLAHRAAILYHDPPHAWAGPPAAAREALAGVPHRPRKIVSTGEAFQSLNLALLKSELAPYLAFGAPDVGQTTHLGPVIKATGVFAPRELPDSFRWLREQHRLAFDWRPSATGKFHAFGIAEGNAMLWAYAFGRRRKVLEGRVPLLPVVTVYDKFFERGFNQLDYAVYSGARFVAVGTPSGTGLSRETATHQSLQTLRMMMDLPGILAYEPAFAADFHAIYLHALGQLWDDDGEAVYLRLTTQPLEQPSQLPPDHAERAIRGAWWLVGEDDRKPRGAAERVVFVASGRKLREVRRAAARLHAEDGVGSRILNVTSYEALWRDWDAYNGDPAAWDDPERSHYLNDLFTDADLNAPLVIVGDHLPSAAEWLPSALQRLRGHRFLGPRGNGEAGDLESVDRLHGMGVDDIVAAARAELSWRARHGLGRTRGRTS